MNRIKDYAGFAGWFAGLGYIVLWPVTATNMGGKPFGAALFCREDATGLLDSLCQLPHPLHLPEGLHALGLLSALFVAFRLLMLAVRRTRRAARARHAAPAAALSQDAPPPRRMVAPAPRRTVKPRSQFGLRGMPH